MSPRPLSATRSARRRCGSGDVGARDEAARARRERAGCFRMEPGSRLQRQAGPGRKAPQGTGGRGGRGGVRGGTVIETGKRAPRAARTGPAGPIRHFQVPRAWLAMLRWEGVCVGVLIAACRADCGGQSLCESGPYGVWAIQALVTGRW